MSLINNLSRPGQTPAEGDMIEIVKGETRIKKVFHAPVGDFGLQPTFTLSHLLDCLGEEIAEDFFLSSTRRTKFLFKRLELGKVWDMVKIQDVAKVRLLQADGNIVGFNKAEADALIEGKLFDGAIVE